MAKRPVTPGCTDSGTAKTLSGTAIWKLECFYTRCQTHDLGGQSHLHGESNRSRAIPNCYIGARNTFSSYSATNYAIAKTAI
jgi:hypothetical protein